MNKKRKIQIIALIGLAAVIACGLVVFALRRVPGPSSAPETEAVLPEEPEEAAEQPADSVPAVLDRPACLREGETAEYAAGGKKDIASVEIIIKNKEGDEINKFDIEIVNPNIASGTIKLRPCGVYAMKWSNYDNENNVYLPGFKAELWKYGYDGSGEKKILLSQKSEDGIFQGYYSYLSETSPDEKYVGLIRGYAGSKDHALIVKDLETLQDTATVDFAEIKEQVPGAFGSSMGLREWSADSRYLWADAFAGANVRAYVRMDVETGKSETFPAPSDSRGGDALNPDLGLVTCGQRLPWSGIADIQDEMAKEWEEEGKKTNLRVYDLLGGKEVFVVHVSDDPYWWGEPRWISRTELEYVLPDETKKVWTVPKEYLEKIEK